MKIIYSGIIMTLLGLSSYGVLAKEIDKTIDSQKGGEVSIQVDKGRIEIIGWNKAKSKVVGEIDNDIKEFKFETRGNKTTLVIASRRNQHGGGNDTDIKVYIPNETELEFEGVNSSVEAREISGEIEIVTVNGEIGVESLSGDIELNTVNGDINGKKLSGEIQYETINGNISDKNSSGDELEIKTVNGEVLIDTQIEDIDLDGTNVQSKIKMNNLAKVEMTTVNGELNLDAKTIQEGASVEVQSVHGDIELTLPTDKGFDVDIHILKRGNIKNKLSKHKAEDISEWGHAGGKQLKFEIGGGGAEIEIDAVEGDIKLNPRK